MKPIVIGWSLEHGRLHKIESSSSAGTPAILLTVLSTNFQSCSSSVAIRKRYYWKRLNQCYKLITQSSVLA
ncbi:hypothetical protein LENED_006235 [Lentinula edodes]|uniref:Uncharacterized protein n=1 Tax=Lentinula edodes TaxID=5353 RepID=A0A1Q3EB38_LENED|nr:hypothetical protein LENED_006235 [Lentinula edodes]